MVQEILLSSASILRYPRRCCLRLRHSRPICYRHLMLAPCEAFSSKSRTLESYKTWCAGGGQKNGGPAGFEKSISSGGCRMPHTWRAGVACDVFCVNGDGEMARLRRVESSGATHWRQLAFGAPAPQQISMTLARVGEASPTGRNNRINARCCAPVRPLCAVSPEGRAPCRRSR